MKLAWMVSVLLAIAMCGAQDSKEGLTKPKINAPKSVSNAPVTQAEAKEIFARAEHMLSKVIKTKQGSNSIPISTAPVSRTQIVKEMNRLFEACKPQFKFTPKKTLLDSRPLKSKEASERQMVTKLIQWGCVGKISTIAVGPADTFTVHEFGDAVGFFMARMAQLTHLPTPKWTPALGGGGG